MHKIPKGFIIIFFIFFLVIFPTLFLTNQYSSMFQTFLISLFASCFSALFYYMIFLGIKQLFKFFKGKPENRTIKPDSSRNVIMTEPVTDISLESVNCTSKCNHSKFEPQKEKSTHSYQDTSLLSTPNEVLQSMRQSFTFSQAQNCERIIQESLDIIRKTNNLDTFFSRSELAMQNALTLHQAEQAGISGVHNTYETCQTVFETIQKKKVLALDFSFESEKEKISKLVKPQSKIRHWEKYLEVLDKYMDEYDSDFSSEYLEIYSYIKREIQELNYQLQLEPVNNATTNSSLSKSENEILFKYFSCENFSDLESRFMLHLHKAIVNANLNPYGIKLHRLSSGTFNVDYSDSRGGCYVGKIDLSSYTTVPDKYAVMKNGQKRARRVLDSEEEAKAYMEQHGGDYIEFRPGHPAQYYMQYLSGKDGCDIHTIESSDFQDYVNGISHWIKYIKECQKPLKFD